MGVQAGVGNSVHRNPIQAAKEAAAAAFKQLGTEHPDLVVMFATTGYDQRALVKAVREATGRAPLVGCSAEGVISSAGSQEGSHAVLVAALKSKDVRFDIALANNLKADSHRAGLQVGQSLQSKVKPDTLGMLLFPDGLSINFDALSAGLTEGLAAKTFIPMFGGTSADDWQLKQTYQYLNDEVLSDSVVAVLISGASRMAWAVNHGCVPLGSERKITRAENNVIQEIDGKPALEVMKEYLEVGEENDWQRTAVNLTIGFKAPGELRAMDEYIIRYVPVKNDEQGSITISTSVKEGTGVWMTRRDQDKISNGLEKIAAQLQDQLHGEAPGLVFQFDCAGRGKVILAESEKQRMMAKLRDNVAPDAPWIGFHSYGEIGPVSRRNWFHNYTAVLAAIV